MPEVEYEVRGMLELNARIRAIGPAVREQIENILELAAREGADAMIAASPKGESLELSSSIGVGQPVYGPGGAGGGGFIEVPFGPGYGAGPAPAYLRYVVYGTGEDGPTGSPIKSSRGNIVDKRGNVREAVMKFDAVEGGDLYRTEVSGQSPNDQWIEAGREEASKWISVGIKRIVIPG